MSASTQPTASAPASVSVFARFRKPLIAIVLLAAVVVAFVFFDARSLLNNAVVYIKDAGPVGIVVFALLYVAACVFFIPGSALTLGAGFIYGVVWGTAIVSMSSVLGATAAFLVGRYLARSWVEGKVTGNEKFRAIDSAVGKSGFKIVLLTRLSPVFPFNLLNYAYGLTSARLRDYVLASWIGMLPGTLMFVYFGSLITDITGVGDQPEGNLWSSVLKYVGLAVTVVVTVYVTRVAKRALEEANHD